MTMMAVYMTNGTAEAKQKNALTRTASGLAAKKRRESSAGPNGLRAARPLEAVPGGRMAMAPTLMTTSNR